MGIYVGVEILSAENRAKYRDLASQGGAQAAHYIEKLMTMRSDPDNDVPTGETTYSGNEIVMRYLPEYVGKVLKVEVADTYLGDGDTHYYGRATIVEDDGSYRTVPAGRGGGWYASDVKLDGCEVDITPERLAAYNAYVDNEKRLRAIEEINFMASKPRAGCQVFVARGRKEKGRRGVCFWAGDTKFGRSVGVFDSDRNKFFTAEHNVDVVFTPLSDSATWDEIEAARQEVR